MAHNENNNIIKTEIQKLNNLNKFGNFIGLITYYHLKRFKHSNCGNCKFIDSITNIYIENFEKKENGIKELQNFCREYFENFFSLITLISSLAIIERKKVELEK